MILVFLPHIDILREASALPVDRSDFKGDGARGRFYLKIESQEHVLALGRCQILPHKSKP
ncbi:hypothetical protein B0T16DRAFT_215072 [Cercophora newfieldiana]|uniref:Uncharacterized protein n=1 Tax=Cercophora newfieldiana TaxID=92897 RepID=A0AA39XY39_9PEZI|nr:hypothetical protein B0T16DRAFT_215072 [Cercophora newfieldiana]